MRGAVEHRALMGIAITDLGVASTRSLMVAALDRGWQLYAHTTPRGTYTVSEKVRKGKMSTIYKCPLPGWMRLGETAVGMHQGDLPGYPASHGCIRMPSESALFIFDQVQVGTPVEVVDSWKPQPAGEQQAKLVADVN